MEEYLTYQKFSEEGAAVELADALRQNGIDNLIEDTSSNFDPSFANNEFAKEFRVKLKKEDFRKAEEILIGLSQKQLNNVDKDYYLFSFTDDELFEVIRKPDEWNQFDYVLSQRLLKERGKELKPEDITVLKNERIAELALPEKSHRGWIMAGYIFAILGGLFAIFIGWQFATNKKTLPNGEKVYTYCPSDRIHGNRIFLIGILSFILWTIVGIFI